MIVLSPEDGIEFPIAKQRNELFPPPLGQEPGSERLALWRQLAAGSNAFCHLKLTAWIEPRLSILRHVPGTRHRMAMNRQWIAVRSEARELIAFARSPALVP